MFIIIQMFRRYAHIIFRIW